MEKHLDPGTWYSNRQLDFTPVHFVITKTPLSIESMLWVMNNLRGRFSIVRRATSDDKGVIWSQPYDLMGIPAFEDPKEAVLYELTWT